MSAYDNLTETQQFACRVIADHARSTAFSIADGILPGNEGRNYVLRKIMRRAIYHGREHLGLKDLFFYKVCDNVIDEMHAAYPELETQRDFIAKMVRLEEERFGNTIIVGLSKLDDLLEDSKKNVVEGTPIQLQPHDLAYLYDTYGLPIDLMYVVLGNKNVILRPAPTTIHTFPISELEEEKFKAYIDASLKILQRLSGVGKTERKSQINPIYSSISDEESRFHGYDTTFVKDAWVLGIIKDDERVREIYEGDEALIFLNDTPFYAEAGGQVGDSGRLVSEGVLFEVYDTFAPFTGITLHKGKLNRGSLKLDDEVDAIVDQEKRDATRRNHTATHLVHAALREVLGTHIKQAGSVVAPNYLRFDYTHYQPITAAEMAEIEDLVNRYILQNEPVNTNVMAIEEAMRGGAMALFGEKYGADVRVLSVGDGIFSKELCGGTHVRATGDIGSFKITSDEAIASGVRRIRAITGFDAFERFREDERLIDRSLGALKTQRDQLPAAIEKLQEELRKTRKEMDELKLKIATGSIGGGSADGEDPRDVAGVKVMARIVEDLDSNGVRQLSDTLLARLKSGVVVIGRNSEGKVGIIVRVSDDLTDRVKAGNIIKEIAPIIGGRGGGKADMAEGGGNLPEKLQEAIDASYGVIEALLA